MRRALLIALLSFGTVAGYASGFAHLRPGCGHQGYPASSWTCPCHDGGAAPAQLKPPPEAAPPATP